MRQNVEPPGFKMRARAGANVGAVDADDVVVLILHPDAALEISVAGIERMDVDHEAAHLAQHLAAHRDEVVVATVEVLGIEQDVAREIGAVGLAAHAAEHAGAEAALGKIGYFAETAILEAEPAEKILVADRHGSHLGV